VMPSKWTARVCLHPGRCWPSIRSAICII